MKKQIIKIQIPNVEKEYLNRPVDSLLASLQERVIILNAEAGYGKTQVLANYVSRCGQKSAWYNLSENDNDFMSFVQNFTRAVSAALGHEGEAFDAEVSLQEDFDILVENLVLWLDERIDGMNVILDDFQEIKNSDIMNLLDVLIETLGEKIRFFIVGRRSLPLFLEECVSNGIGVCIGTEELKFQQSEIELLLEQSADQKDVWKSAELIYTTTEGWPVGVAQILIQIRRQRKKVSYEMIRTICDQLEVSDFFMTQVYQMLPFDIQTFLKKTAVLDYMTAQACNQIVGIYNSESMLRYLVSEKLFIQSLGEEIGLYRYHSIFQRFLLGQSTPEQRRESMKKAAYYYLKTGDRIQAAEFGCRAEADDVVLAVIEVYGEQMLKEHFYDTIRRWFEYLNRRQCALSAKAQLVYGKYLWEMGSEAEAKKQINEAGKRFYQDGKMTDYKRVLLFVAASERKAGNMSQAEMCLKEAETNREKYWNSMAEELCTEKVKYACCLHRRDIAEEAIRYWTDKGVRFEPHSFLEAAEKVFCHGNGPERPGLRLLRTEEGFLLQSYIRGERLREAYRQADREAVRREASGLIENAEHETLQTAIAWKLLAILSWKDGDYRKAVEQAEIGDRFLYKNRIELNELSEGHRQILSEIGALKRGTMDARYFLARKEESETGGQQDGKIHIRSFKKFSVFLPGDEENEMKWRTKKAQELFAYLFHLQGGGVAREDLIALLWPDTGTKSATALFHTTLYSIRQAFVQAGMADLIIYDKKMYSLNMDMVRSDLEEFSEALQNFRSDEAAAEKAVELYTGGYMENTGYLWSYTTAKKLENDYLEICRFMSEKEKKAGKYERAVPFLQRMYESEPYDEAVVTDLIHCLYESGKRTEARNQYERMARLYKEDLGIEFDRSFQELVER